MGFNLDEDNPVPSIQESEDKIARDAAKAIKHLEKTSNMDLAEALGLSAFV